MRQLTLSAWIRLITWGLRTLAKILDVIIVSHETVPRLPAPSIMAITAPEDFLKRIREMKDRRTRPKPPPPPRG